MNLLFKKSVIAKDKCFSLALQMSVFLTSFGLSLKFLFHKIKM